MDKRSVNKCAILLALIACSHAIIWAECRHLKYKEKEETAKRGSNKVNLHQNSAELKEDFQSTKPIVDIPRAENSASVTGENEIFPSMSFGELAASDIDTDDFRPTTPGSSPGVGHKHAKEEEDVETKVIVDIFRAENTSSVTGKKEIVPPMTFGESAPSDKDDFRPTAPGKSPGVGHKHATEEEDVETKVIVDIFRAENTSSATAKKEILPPMTFGESAPSDKDDFRPTAPGNSPGVAYKHAKEEDDVETNVVVNKSLDTGSKTKA